MKKTLHYFALILLAFILMIGGSACMENPKKPSTNRSQSSEESSSIETNEMSDREIVEAVWNEIQGTDSVWNGEGIDYIGEDMKLAEALSGKLFGSITSEEDAKEKGRAAIIEIEGAYEGSERPFSAKFYEKYDVWLIRGTLPGQDEQGNPLAVPGSVPYVIMRTSDGKVLAFGIL